MIYPRQYYVLARRATESVSAPLFYGLCFVFSIFIFVAYLFCIFRFVFGAFPLSAFANGGEALSWRAPIEIPSCIYNKYFSVNEMKILIVRMKIYQKIHVFDSINIETMKAIYLRSRFLQTQYETDKISDPSPLRNDPYSTDRYGVRETELFANPARGNK